jgi:hypothetical protein
MAYKPGDFPQFTPPDSLMARAWLAKLKDYLLHNIVSALGITSVNEVKVNRNILFEIFTRIEKRRVYFHIYHNVEMGEINEGALVCFWILKLMPFQMKGISNALLNTKIAYIVFVNLLHYIVNKTSKEATADTPKLHVNIKKKIMDDLLYAFQYRDLSKEAIMALAESHLY